MQIRFRDSGRATLLPSRLLPAVVLCINALAARAAIPTLDYIFPAGGKQGETITITAAGKLDPWPAQATTDGGGVVLKPLPATGQFSVEIAKDAAIGPHLVRVHNADGASSPRIFIVGRAIEVMEKGPNDDARQAQSIDALPATINGQLEKSGDVDSFAVKLDAGRWLVGCVEGRSLNSPMDPFLDLIGPQGNEVAFAHDGHGLDPLLAYRVEKAGTYVVQIAAFAYPPVADVRFTGSKACVYRLTLTSGPYVHHAFPSGARRGHKSPLQLVGWNLGQESGTMGYAFDASLLNHGVDVAWIDSPDWLGRPRLALSDLPEIMESEPNNSASTAQPFTAPAIINGRIDPAGDQDRFSFTAKKGDRYNIIASSPSLGFPLDAVLRVEDSAGKQLSSSSSSNPNTPQDAKLDWIAPDDGAYIIAISDLMHRGGRDFVYRLQVAPPLEGMRMTLEADAVRVTAGKSIDVKLNVTRANGNGAPLVAVATGLPEGVAATSADVPAKGGAIKLTLTAAPDARAANQPFRVLLISTDPAHPYTQSAIFDLAAKETNPDLLINQHDAPWLTVIAASATTRPATQPIADASESDKPKKKSKSK